MPNKTSNPHSNCLSTSHNWKSHAPNNLLPSKHNSKLHPFWPPINHWKSSRPLPTRKGKILTPLQTMNTTTPSVNRNHGPSVASPVHSQFFPSPKTNHARKWKIGTALKSRKFSHPPTRKRKHRRFARNNLTPKHLIQFDQIGTNDWRKLCACWRISRLSHQPMLTTSKLCACCGVLCLFLLATASMCHTTSEQHPFIWATASLPFLSSFILNLLACVSCGSWNGRSHSYEREKIMSFRERESF